jgi:hypothetical protein
VVKSLYFVTETQRRYDDLRAQGVGHIKAIHVLARPDASRFLNPSDGTLEKANAEDRNSAAEAQYALRRTA